MTYKITTTTNGVFYVNISKYLLEDYSVSYCAAMELDIEESKIKTCKRI